MATVVVVVVVVVVVSADRTAAAIPAQRHLSVLVRREPAGTDRLA
jgi:hypothetical protein